jgi:hypothetical protein
LEGRQQRGGIIHCGQDNRLGPRLTFPQQQQCLQPRSLGQLDVHQHNLDIQLGQSLPEFIETRELGLQPIAGIRGEHLLQREALFGIIFQEG